jgi:hypothetical protein
MAEQETELDRLRGQLAALELRLRRLESAWAYGGGKDAALTEVPENIVSGKSMTAAESGEERGLESRIGRFGLAWMGNIVLLFGITFLSQYLMNLGQPFLSALIGYGAAGIIYIISEYLKKSNLHLSFMFRINALALLFYVTLRLHFFSVQPLIGSKGVAASLLIIISLFQGYMAIKNKLQSFASLAVIFVLITAVVSDNDLLFITLILAGAAWAVFCFKKYTWRALYSVTILFTFIVFLIWLIGDPLMGHPLKLIASANLSVICLFILGALYSIPLYTIKGEEQGDDFIAGVAVANGVFFTLMLAVVTLGFFSTSYVLLFGAVAIGCLLYSVLLHARSAWNFGTAFYALYGFMALSVAIYGLVGLPSGYLLLTLQSLLVVSLALWFRNRLIVIMNSHLFLIILVAYLTTSKSHDGVNFSFAIVALVTARVINWQRTRLKIETDFVRNLYMIEGFVMMLIALHNAMPKQFVTLSWTMAALLYFLLSLLLKNVKYRYMALGTMICAAIYLFIIDLARIELVYRILALLFLSLISIGISIYYSQRIKKPGI